MELCRSLSNNMFYYRAIKPIKRGEPLLAWYSDTMEQELFKRVFQLPNNNQNNTNMKHLNLLLESNNGK